MTDFNWHQRYAFNVIPFMLSVVSIFAETKFSSSVRNILRLFIAKANSLWI